MAKRKSAAQKNSQSAMTIAAKRTQAKLANRQITKTVTTYPKGLYAKTMKIELNKAMGELCLTEKCKDKNGLSGRKKKRSLADKVLGRK